jgi:hypothetical protein
MSEDRCRFCRLFALSLVGFATLLALLGSFGAHDDYRFYVFLWQTLRALAPAAVGSAFLLALVLWGQPLPAPKFAAEFRRILLRGAMISLPGYFLASLLAIAIGALANFSMGLSLSGAQKAIATVNAWGLLLGLVSTACDAGLVVVLALRFAARLHAQRGSLPAKLVLVLTVTVPIRVTLALLLTSLLRS